MVAADNIHTLRYRDVPLCVICLSCGHRSLLEADNLRGLGKDLHDMVLIRALEKRLRCLGAQQCARGHVGDGGGADLPSDLLTLG